MKRYGIEIPDVGLTKATFIFPFMEWVESSRNAFIS